MINIECYGDRIVNGSYRIHSKFAKAVNFVHRNQFVAVVTPEIGPGPLNIVVKNMSPGELRSLDIDDSVIAMNEIAFKRNDAVRHNSKIEITIPPGFVDIRQNLSVLKSSLLRLSPPKSLAFLLNEKRAAYFKTTFEKEFIKRFHEGVSLLLNGQPVLGARMLRGLGFGLTPSGDDFLAGFMAALSISMPILSIDHGHVVESIRVNAIGGNPISNSLLACAREGFLPFRYKELIEAVINSDAVTVENRSSQLLEIGETSGVDFGVGFAMAMENTLKTERRYKWLCAAS